MIEQQLSVGELNEIARRLTSHPEQLVRARNWGLVCGFGYGFAAAVLTVIILLCVTA